MNKSFKLEDLRSYIFYAGELRHFCKTQRKTKSRKFYRKSVESVKQDFWSAIFISNLESVMTEDVEEALNMDLTDDKLKRSINKSVSFNAIKNLAFDIFATESDTDCIMDQLSKLFLMNTLAVRKGRKVDRHKVPYLRSFNYQKRVRKHIF